MRHRGDGLEVHDIARGIPDRLNKNAARPLVDQCSNGLGLIVNGKSSLDT